jgi:hypothetical protein
MLIGALIPPVGVEVCATPRVSAASPNVALANGLVNVGVSEIVVTVFETEIAYVEVAASKLRIPGAITREARPATFDGEIVIDLVAVTNS